jgi:hypothetical protein
MALRAICDVEVSDILDELPKIVALGLADSNPYVRRMAILATIHLKKLLLRRLRRKGSQTGFTNCFGIAIRRSSATRCLRC